MRLSVNLEDVKSFPRESATTHNDLFQNLTDWRQGKISSLLFAGTRREEFFFEVYH